MEPIRSFRATHAGEPELHGVLSDEPATPVSPVRLRFQASLCHTPDPGRAGAVFSSETVGNCGYGGIWRVADVSVFGAGAVLSELVQHRSNSRLNALGRMGSDRC